MVPALAGVFGPGKFVITPLDARFAASTHIGFVARGARVHVTALGRRDVAGGVGGMQQVVDRRALDRDFDQADADADVEDLVVPDEPVIRDRAHRVIGDLPGPFERATRERHAEFVAAEIARD